MHLDDQAMSKKLPRQLPSCLLRNPPLPQEKLSQLMGADMLCALDELQSTRIR